MDMHTVVFTGCGTTLRADDASRVAQPRSTGVDSQLRNFHFLRGNIRAATEDFIATEAYA